MLTPGQTTAKRGLFSGVQRVRVQSGHCLAPWPRQRARPSHRVTRVQPLCREAGGAWPPIHPQSGHRGHPTQGATDELESQLLKAGWAWPQI